MRRTLVPILLAAACSSPPSLADAGNGSGAADAGVGGPDAAPGTITPTPVGAPIGLPTDGTIDPDGSTILSADGMLELRFPAGAVASPTSITITPISDEAPLGVAQAWRITPADTALAAPATIVFHLPTVTAQAGDVGTMFVAAQDGQGFWQAGGAALWDPTAGTITSSSALAHLGDWALTSCVGLETDTILAATGGAHLAVVRQCDAPPASGPIGGGTTATDPVAWSDQAEGGGAAGGTLTPSGATATLTAPAQPPSSPVVQVTATVSSADVAPRFTGPRSIMLQRDVAIASFVRWTVDGQTFTGVLGSSVLTHAGMSSVNAASMTPAASLVVQFGGGGIGSYPAIDTHSEVATGTGNDLRYNTQYQDPCTAALETTSQQVDITNASTSQHLMSGQVHGTLAIARGTKQCPSGPTSDIAIVDVDAVFVLLWPGPQ